MSSENCKNCLVLYNNKHLEAKLAKIEDILNRVLDSTYRCKLIREVLEGKGD